MGLQRLPDETDLQYHKRLIYGKLDDKTLADTDYSELAELVYGKPYNTDSCRKMMYGSYETLKLMEREIEDTTPSDLMGEMERKRIALELEKQKFYDQRNAYNKLIRDRAREEELNEILMTSVQSGDLPSLEYTPSTISYTDNTLMVSLNDIHYGADINNYWNTYNSDVCGDMMRGYLDRIFAIQDTHNSGDCVVWANGDLINGNIRYSIAVTNKETVIEQITGVSELIAEFLAELSKRFAHVSYVSVSGNHSRLNPNKDQSLSSERLDDLVEWYLKARLQNFENVTVGDCNRIDPTMYVMDVRGKTYLGVHGDYEATPSKVQSLQTMAGKPVYAILSGHLHHNKIDEIQGVKTVMAGSFLGMDTYCVNSRIYGRPEQLVMVCDENGIRCSYDVPLN